MERDSVIWDLRIGKGGQIYSFIGPFGESVPPSTRSWMEFNTSHWNDDVWQPVCVSTPLNNADDFPLTPELRGAGMRSMYYFIHGAGSYMNDTALRKPFYSPLMASLFSEKDKSFYVTNWGQQAHIPSIHKSGVLYTSRYKDIGNGIIEVNYLLQNCGKDVLNYFSHPWGGVRSSNLPQCWLSKPDNSLERTYKRFSSTDPGIANIDDTGGYFIWAADNENENRPAMALVFGKDIHYNEWGNEYKMNPTRIRWGDGTNNPDRDYSVFVVNPRLNVVPGSTFYFRVYFIVGTMKEVHEKAQLITSKCDYGFINIDPENTPLIKIISSDFDNAFKQDIRLFASPVENMIPVFLMENTVTGNRYISPDLYYDVNTGPFNNPYETGDVKYLIYQNKLINKPYDGKIKYIRLLGYGVEKEKISTNIKFALLDSLIQDTLKCVLTGEYKNTIWIPDGPCVNCAFLPEYQPEEGLILYNGFDNNQLFPWSNPAVVAITDNIDNPDISFQNSSLLVAKVTRGTGTWSNIRFQLPGYLDLSENSTFKVKVYYEGADSLPSNCKIRLILRNNGLGTTQYSVEQNIVRANAWIEHTFIIYHDNMRDTYNQVWLFFSSPDYDSSASGQVFYIDDLEGPPLTINLSSLEISTSENGDSIIIDLLNNQQSLKSITDPVFKLIRSISRENIQISNITFDSTHIFLHLDTSSHLSGRDDLLVSFSSGIIEDKTGKILPFFIDLQVQNTMPLATIGFEIYDGILPVSMAEIQLSDSIVFTDIEGKAIYADFPVNEDYYFKISMTGYESIIDTIHLDKDTTIRISLNPITSIEENLGILKIYPVPATDHFIVETKIPVRLLLLYDLFGKCLLNKEINSSVFRIELPELPTSIYVVKLIYLNNQVSMYKFSILNR